MTDAQKPKPLSQGARRRLERRNWLLGLVKRPKPAEPAGRQQWRSALRAEAFKQISEKYPGESRGSRRAMARARGNRAYGEMLAAKAAA